LTPRSDSTIFRKIRLKPTFAKRTHPTVKTEIVSKMSRLSRALLVATLALAGTASSKADNFFDNTISGIDLGNASGGTTGGHRHWAIFTLGGNVTITDPTPYVPGSVPPGQAPDSYYSTAGSADVYGNVGIYGSGRLSMTNSYINGFVDQFSNVTNTLAGNGANPYFIGSPGSIGHNTTYLQQAYNDAIAASAAAKYLGTPAGLLANPTVVLGSATTAVITSAKSEVDLGISGGGQAGETYVLNLTDLILQGTSAVLTLNGTATTNYVINVNRYMSLAGGAKINLAGGITPQNVLYNVNQNTINGVQYDVTLSGGSEARGIILATTRAVKLTGDSKVFGEVIAKSVSLSGSSNVINPLVSP
jgi:hypothetical protein